MYRTINVNENTYQQLQKIATQLHKPKAQVVESLVKEYSKAVAKREKAKLEQFNNEMDTIINSLTFSKKVTVNTNKIDQDYAALADTDYMKEK